MTDGRPHGAIRKVYVRTLPPCGLSQCSVAATSFEPETDAIYPQLGGSFKQQRNEADRVHEAYSADGSSPRPFRHTASAGTSSGVKSAR